MTERHEVPAEVFPLAWILVKKLLVANDRQKANSDKLGKKKKKEGMKVVYCKDPGVAHKMEEEL